MRRHAVTRWMLCAALGFGGGAAQADDLGGRPPGPPPEAVEACSGVPERSACNFTMGDHAVTGSCRTVPDGQAIACVPPHGHGPPPQAFEACQGLAEGVACRLTFHDQAMDGTCRAGPGGEGRLACAPAHPPGR